MEKTGLRVAIFDFPCESWKFHTSFSIEFQRSCRKHIVKPEVRQCKYFTLLTVNRSYFQHGACFWTVRRLSLSPMSVSFIFIWLFPDNSHMRWILKIYSFIDLGNLTPMGKNFSPQKFLSFRFNLSFQKTFLNDGKVS